MSKPHAKLRWGILGVARINRRLIPAFATAANAQLQAIASRSLDRAKVAASAVGIPTAHGSYDALLDDPKIDAVYIPLPNTLHAEWTIRAAEHGKHILCEKPLAPTAGEAEHVVQVCRHHRVLLMEGFMWPHHPRTAMLRRLIDAGDIGAVRHVTSAFSFRMDSLDADNIRLRPELGGGSLLDIGCYPVYAIRWAFVGEPLRVASEARYEHGVDVEMSGLLEFPDARVGAFDCAFTLPFRGYLEITGTDGVIWVPDMWLPGPRATFEVRREGRPTETVVVQGHDQIVHMIEDFGRAVLAHQPLNPSPEEAVRTLRVLDALCRSASTEESKAWLSLSPRDTA
jgi:predicted dehydrogenase